MLKSFAELRKIDVLPYCETREAKDENGKKIQVPYLNWAKCKDLLHENGAEVVYFEPIVNENGSTLFMTDVPFTDSKGNKNRCFEVRVKIVIDDLEFTQNYPLLNGVYVVREDTRRRYADEMFYYFNNVFNTYCQRHRCYYFTKQYVRKGYV